MTAENPVPEFDYDAWKVNANTAKAQNPIAPNGSRHDILRAVGFGLAFAAFVIIVVGWIADGDISTPGDLFMELWSNAGSELASIALTVLFLDVLNRKRSEQQQETTQKRDLIVQMGSSVNDFARQGSQLLWANNWLQDGSVRYANLWGADLEDADLGKADLRWANFWRANLSNTRLWADLRGANLFLADLTHAQLDGGKYGMVKFDAHTVMPDGEYWTPETDMARFTNPQHPDYWQSDNPYSAAHPQNRTRRNQKRG